MTRRRSSAPGTLSPARRRSFLPLFLLVALVAAGCIGQAEVSPSTTASGPTPAASAGATPVETASPSDTLTPTVAPTPTPIEVPTPPPSGGTGSAESCAGNDDNRSFYASVVADVDWPVYCPVLPSGWFVTEGTYRLVGGGWMKIGYRGPGGAHLDLSEGAFCQDDDGCVPLGEDGGTAVFGDQAGTFVNGDDGSLSIVVARGEQLSWLATGTGIDEEAFRSIVAGLNHIEG